MSILDSDRIVILQSTMHLVQATIERLIQGESVSENEIADVKDFEEKLTNFQPEDETEKQCFNSLLKEWQKTREHHVMECLYWRDLLGGIGAQGVELEDNGAEMFVNNVISEAEKDLRKVFVLDCKTLCKYDAIGWLRTISQQPKEEKRPILIIQNITEIPAEDNVHDNPKYVENLLVHSWKNSVNDFTDNRPKQNYEQFTLNSHDYLIFLTWTKASADRINHVWRAGEFALIGNLKENKAKFFADHDTMKVNELMRELNLITK